MTIREFIRKYCKPVVESKLLAKMEEKVLDYSIEKKPAGERPACEAERDS